MLRKVCLGCRLMIPFSGGQKLFLDEEEIAYARFPNTGRTSVSDQMVKFNGLDITRIHNGYRVSQEKYLSEIPDITKADAVNIEEFRSTKAKYAYAAYSTVPETPIHVSHLSQITPGIFKNDKSEVLKLLKKLLKLCPLHLDILGLRL